MSLTRVDTTQTPGIHSGNSPGFKFNTVCSRTLATRVQVFRDRPRNLLGQRLHPMLPQYSRARRMSRVAHGRGTSNIRKRGTVQYSKGAKVFCSESIQCETGCGKQNRVTVRSSEPLNLGSERSAAPTTQPKIDQITPGRQHEPTDHEGATEILPFSAPLITKMVRTHQPPDRNPRPRRVS